jgi:predicted nucleic-acid-binding protein
VRDVTERYAIDANVILRYLTRDVEEQYQKAACIMEAVQDDMIQVFCEPVTLAEVVWVLGRLYGLSRQQIYEGLAPVIATRAFQMPNKARYIRALELHSTTIPHFGDACACAAALETCEGRLFSFDKALSGIDGIERLEAAPAE